MVVVVFVTVVVVVVFRGGAAHALEEKRRPANMTVLAIETCLMMRFMMCSMPCFLRRSIV